MEQYFKMTQNNFGLWQNNHSTTYKICRMVAQRAFFKHLRGFVTDHRLDSLNHSCFELRSTRIFMALIG
jgi:hypothetical protein